MCLKNEGIYLYLNLNSFNEVFSKHDVVKYKTFFLKESVNFTVKIL